MNNTEILQSFFDENLIAIKRGKIFDTLPSPHTQEAGFDRIDGMLLGLAIGDSLGNTSESMTPAQRRARYGEIRDYLPNVYADWRPVGLPSDDTQLAFWTLEQIIADGEFIPENVARRFCRQRIFGIGQAVREFVYNHKTGRPWYKSGARSAGNGALMRIAPILVPHIKNGGHKLWIDTALCAMITHNDSASIASCMAFVRMLWLLLDMKEPPAPRWYLETCVETLKDLETNENYSPRGGDFIEFTGSVNRFVEERVSEAFARNLTAEEACNSWFSGAYLLETVPSVIYILMKHGHDFEEAVVRAVNDTRDNDTIGAIVGAAMGALHGRSRIPDRWVRSLLGRTGDDDDGKIFDLLSQVSLIKSGG